MTKKKLELYSPEDVHDEFGGFNNAEVPDYVKKDLAIALSYCPREIVDDITSCCRFIYIEPNRYNGYYIPFNDEKVTVAIVYNYGTGRISRMKKIELILHEVAHYVLKHNLNHVGKCLPSSVTKTHYNRQEKEADELVARWLKNRKNIPKWTEGSIY